MVSPANPPSGGNRWWWLHPFSLIFCLFYQQIAAQTDANWQSRSADWNQQPSYLFGAQPTPATGHYITSPPVNLQQHHHHHHQQQQQQPLQQQLVQTSSGSQDLRSFCRSSRGQFPSANGCHKFVNCWDGDVIEQECPTGLLFTTRGYCDYAWNVQCEGRALPPASEIAAGTPPGWNPYQEQAICPGGDGTLTRSANDCGSFVVCHHGIYEKIACPAGLHFNQELKVCDFPESARCVYNSGYVQEKPSPVTIPPPQPPQSISQNYPQPPLNNYASQTFNQYNENPVKSVNEIHHVTRLPAELVAGAASLTCREGATFPLVLGSCQHVSVCRFGRATLVHCPEGQGFDTYSARCRPAEISRC